MQNCGKVLNDLMVIGLEIGLEIGWVCVRMSARMTVCVCVK